MDKEYAASFFYAPSWKRMTKPEGNPQKGPYTIKFQLSAFTSVSPLCANLEGGADDNMVSSVLVLHRMNH